ncbi:MAG: heat-inducible transcriptional repressor HrcA [Alphaproteobacteria bacterium]
MLNELNQRARTVLGHIVSGYIETGEATASRTLSRMEDLGVSPATIRNVMADLEDAGLLYAPHSSAGRLPTAQGLKLFIDGILEIGTLNPEEQKQIDEHCHSENDNITRLMEKAGDVMSNISLCAGLVVAPSLNRSLKHMEFIRLNAEKALVVMVDELGMVENRIIDLPAGIPAQALVSAGNYISSHLVGRDLKAVQQAIESEINTRQSQLDSLSTKLVTAGLASWSSLGNEDAVLVVRGQGKMLQDVSALEDLERVRSLFMALEVKENLLKLLTATEGADGVKIFIGAETRLFGMSDCSVIVSPYQDQENKIIGAVGVVGPLRMNYARIIPMVNYTAEMVSKFIGNNR